jgi:uncharacterized protein
MDYYDGKLIGGKKRETHRNLTIEQERTAKEERNMDLDKKLDAIIKAEETKLALEKFQADFETNLENLTFEQKKLLVDLLVDSIEVTTVASQLNLNIKLRFDQSKVLGKEAVGEPKKKLSQSHKVTTEELNIRRTMVEGVVRNVVAFWAFVDIGLKNDGLVHVSEIANQYVKNPMDFLSVGQEVKARVLKIDTTTGKIQLSLREIK